ncbi:hypothetical protein [Paenibacillus hexagrammi]|uniref:Uncharacterized protein n=1 Tax=Paenibacillus hexagrammi TaxID=2908839 RepID=A0ABY3SGK7_9BACL|nr:hypothetical protein [Paenibacillus sp. YPD9-1]UJF32230.1 hypothetical protein L0M14_21270 [Paenibacillus sp. YPD9-1]
MKLKKISIFLSAIISLSLIATVASAAPAASADTKTTDKDKLQKVMAHVKQMRDSGSSIEDITKYKKTQGIETKSYNTIYVDENGNEISSTKGFSTQSLEAQYRAITNYIDYDGSTGEYIINSEVKATTGLCGCDPIIWLADADKRDDGTVLFNLKDNWFRDALQGYTAYSWVVVRPLTSSSTSTTSSVKYTHTYETTQTTTSYTGSADWTWYSSGTIGVSYTVNTSNIEAKWDKSATANVYVN